MSEFRTKLPPFRAPISLSHHERLIGLGSCFVEHIGQRLERLKFEVLCNPSGILFNPVSVGEALVRLIEGRPYTSAELFEHQGLWHSFSHHGRFSHPDQQEALRQMNASLERAAEFFSNATRLVLTLGTAHVFVWRQTGQVVANCHKLPGHAFDRRRLSPRQVVEALAPALALAQAQRPGLQVIATVSPVRHLRDGLLENQRSKAALLLALDELCQSLGFVHYFPAYELLLDDLRDYRFYDADMAHPSSQAIDYIWRYFEGAFFDGKTAELCGQIGRLAAAAEHRPLHPGSAAHQAFARQQLLAIDALEKACPSLDFRRERVFFEQSVEASGQ